MASATTDPAVASGKIEAFTLLFRQGNRACQKNLAAIPDDKVHYKPGETARSAMEIGAHVAAANEYFIRAFQGNPPASELPQIMAWIDDHAKTYKTREDVAGALKGTYDQLDAILSNVPPSALDDPRAYTGLWVSAIHAWQHSSQLDYLQTCWGDMAFHTFTTEGAS